MESERKEARTLTTPFSWPLYGLLTIALGLSKAKTPINDLLSSLSLRKYLKKSGTCHGF